MTAEEAKSISYSNRENVQYILKKIKKRALKGRRVLSLNITGEQAEVLKNEPYCYNVEFIGGENDDYLISW